MADLKAILARIKRPFANFKRLGSQYIHIFLTKFIYTIESNIR